MTEYPDRTHKIVNNKMKHIRSSSIQSHHTIDLPWIHVNSNNRRLHFIMQKTQQYARVWCMWMTAETEHKYLRDIHFAFVMTQIPAGKHSNEIGSNARIRRRIQVIDRIILGIDTMGKKERIRENKKFSIPIRMWQYFIGLKHEWTVKLGAMIWFLRLTTFRH